MKKMKLWLLAAILLCGAGCKDAGQSTADDQKTDQDSVDLVEATGDFDFMPVVDKYLVDSIGAFYAPAEICIPCATIVACEQPTPDSAMVWGDFWVFNFNVVGDTLKTISGGDHPGLMCLKKNAKGEFEVVTFDRVVDGHGNLESAKRIFGEMYEAFHGINSDEETREEARSLAIARYVKAHKLPVKYYQDYGWPAHEIPEKLMRPKN